MQVVPGGGSISVCISFTPHVLPETVTEVQCEGFALGFMSLDGKVNWYPSRAKDDWEIIVSIPVISRAGCCVLGQSVQTVLFLQPRTSFLNFISCIYLLAWKLSGVGMSTSCYVVWSSRPQAKAQDLNCYHNIRFY